MEKIKKVLNQKAVLLAIGFVFLCASGSYSYPADFLRPPIAEETQKRITSVLINDEQLAKNALFKLIELGKNNEKVIEAQKMHKLRVLRWDDLQYIPMDMFLDLTNNIFANQDIYTFFDEFGIHGWVSEFIDSMRGSGARRNVNNRDIVNDLFNLVRLAESVGGSFLRKGNKDFINSFAKAYASYYFAHPEKDLLKGYGLIDAIKIKDRDILDIGTGLSGILHIRNWEDLNKLVLFDENIFITTMLKEFLNLTGKTNIEVIQGDITKYEPAQKINCLRANLSLHHLPSKPGVSLEQGSEIARGLFFKKAFSILENKGVLIISDRTDEFPDLQKKEFIGDPIEHITKKYHIDLSEFVLTEAQRSLYAGHFKVISYLCDALEENGFSVAIKEVSRAKTKGVLILFGLEAVKAVKSADAPVSGLNDTAVMPSPGVFGIQLALEILKDPLKKEFWQNALTSLFFQIRTLGFGDMGLPAYFSGPIVNEFEAVWSERILGLSKSGYDQREIRKIIDDMRNMNAMSLWYLPKEVIKGRTFVVRVDFNDIHFDAGEEEIDDIRLNASYETLDYILSNEGRLVLLTHSGRPSGQGADDRFNLEHVRGAVKKLLGISDVLFLRGKEVSPGKYAVVTDEIVNSVKNMKNGEVALLDNMRFDWREKSENLAERIGLASDLSRLGDIYVLDGFPISHRPDTSVNEMHMTGMPSIMGFWMERELKNHNRLFEYMEAPGRGAMAAIFGGIKQDKIELIRDFAKKMRAGDKILIGGLLAEIIKKEYGDLTTDIMNNGVEIILALDNVDGRDIGPKTIDRFKGALSGVEFVYWNSPQGQFEVEPYHKGSYAIADYIKERMDSGFMSIFVSGGETAPLVKSALNLNEERRKHLENIERVVGTSGIKMPVLVISTGGGTTTYFIAYDRKNIGRDSLWGISPFYMSHVFSVESSM